MREFLGTMTGPKVGVYSLRRAQSALRPRAAAADRLGVDCTSGGHPGIALSRRLSNMAVGVQQHCARGIALLLSILREHFAACQATKPATD